jgi:hypothetical protein
VGSVGNTEGEEIESKKFINLLLAEIDPLAFLGVIYIDESAPANKFGDEFKSITISRVLS